MRSVNPDTGIKGLDIVLRNLNREISKIEQRTLKGLIHAAIIVRRDMEKNIPYIPLDLGNLRASWFTVTARGNQSSTPKFEGKDSDKFSTEHSSMVSEGKAMLQANKNPIIMMGFTANYAAGVHEATDPNIHWSKEGSGPKFFQRALERKKTEIVEVIKKYAQISNSRK
jgi:hypothetical protein